jgi:hypothetical protein
MERQCLLRFKVNAIIQSADGHLFDNLVMLGPKGLTSLGNWLVGRTCPPIVKESQR